MQRTLSLRHTWLLKFVLPPVWLGIVGYAIWHSLSRPDDAFVDRNAGLTTTALTWVFFALIAASLSVLFAFVVPLKRVRLTPDGLRVSNYVREITIPFAAIARVRQNWLPTFRLIRLDLRTETPLGRHVIFMPVGSQGMAFWRAEYRREDEVVAELRRLAGLAD
jgi:hypothetical protein